jgi:transcriptional regulator with XRE-family HTH domain
MDECMGKDLASARKAAGLFQFQVGHLLHVSEDVVSNWENNDSTPTPDQVDELEKLYKAPGLWHRWMRSHYKSYRDRYAENPAGLNAALAVVNAGYQAADMKSLTDALVRDLMDGKCDDLELKAKYLKEAKENVAAHNAAIAMLESEGN